MVHEFEHDRELLESRWFEEQQKTLDIDPVKLDAAFEIAEGVCTCIDEGTNGDVRLAGSGILHPGGIEKVAELLRAEGVTEITAHEHCGAAALAYRRDHPDEHEIDNAKVDQYAADWSRQLADALGVDYRYIEQGEMQRPAHMHDASAVYIDRVGHFRPDLVPELPKGFVVTELHGEPLDMLRDVELAVSIALGSAGFGEKFTPEQPLKIVVVGESNAIIDQHLEELTKQHGGRIQVSVVPVAARAAEEIA